MATITFNYNQHNAQAQNLVNYILSTGFLMPVVDKDSSLAYTFDNLTTAKTKPLFADTFGMWSGRDVDIKKIRQERRQRRTKNYDNVTL